MTNFVSRLTMVAIIALGVCLPAAARKTDVPQVAPYAQTMLSGELSTRVQRNMLRLEEEKYQPQNVFLTEEQSLDWPGDTEGRTILALTLDAQA